jgi:hypothetical protein
MHREVMVRWAEPILSLARVGIPRIKVGERQTIETLINEEALLFAKYLRNEKREWLPRISV